MIRRQERNSQGPSIKQLLEALAEEERRDAMPPSPATLRPVQPAPTYHHPAGHSSHPANPPHTSAPHPAHVAHAALVAQANGWPAPVPRQPVNDTQYELGVVTSSRALERAAHNAKVPRRAAPSPPTLIAIDIDEPHFDNYIAAAHVPFHADGEVTPQPLQSRFRVPWIARHAFAAAGALAVILPCVFYLTAPVIDRMANRAQPTRSTDSIVQRGVSVTKFDASKATAEATSVEHVDAAQPAPKTPPGLKQKATATLGSIDHSATAPGTPTQAPTTAAVSSIDKTLDTSRASLPFAGTPGWQAQSLPLSPDASRTMTQERAAALLARGQELAASRDITAARQYFERAAEGGSARAALEAARTYDPNQLREHGLFGLKPDTERAIKYYRQADAGGLTAAREMLERLGSQ